MKYLLLFSFLLFSQGSFAKTIQESIELTHWQEAKDHPQRLQFVVESTKVGLFSSDVDGYAKSFVYQAEYDEQYQVLRQMQITIKAKSMDTDHESRDEKLHQLCLSVKEYPHIEITVPGPLFLASARPQELAGEVLIRGQKKPIKVTLTPTLKDGKVMIEGKSVWSLQAMEIPDPSIAVAKLSDEIEIHIRLQGLVKK